MKLLFVNGSRGEWGYIKPIIDYCKSNFSDVDCGICATNMMLLNKYGCLVQELERSGYNVVSKISMSIEGGTHNAMAKSLPLFQLSFCDLLEQYRPDWVVLAGDRGEQLAAAMAASYSYVPSAHIQAGERSGNIDGIARHAIGKLVNVHFAANDDAAKRLIRLGEEDFRIFNVGAPQLDDMLAVDIPDKSSLVNQLGLPNWSEYLLCVLHPVTEEYRNTGEMVEKVVSALDKIHIRRIWILPNNDAGSDAIREHLLNTAGTDVYLYKNLSRPVYLSLLKYALAIIGNSSSGLIEAPLYRIPAVNIGSRQADRIAGANVLSCSTNTMEIEACVRSAISTDFKNSLHTLISPYGDGKSSARIISALKSMRTHPQLFLKRIHQ
jgi:GDP/UDP-N,N'-diacetylbacillosamine 2-epimerase (hydrolysing)